MKKMLMTSEWCGPCKLIKQRLAAEGIEVEILDFGDAENIDTFRKYKITNVPRLVVEHDDGNVEIIEGTENILANLRDKN